MKRTLVAGLVLALFLFGGSLEANATLLAPGYNNLTGTTVALQPNLAGTVVEDETITFSFTNDSGLVQGIVQSRVVLSIDGTYDFYWRIRDTSSDDAGAMIGSLRIADFFTTIYNGDFRSDGLGNIGPDQALLFSDPSGNPSGGINFIFSNGLNVSSSQESLFFFLDTDAINYAKTAKFDLTGTGTGGISGQFDTYAPAPVPVPGTLLLLGSGILSLIGLRRRKD